MKENAGFFLHLNLHGPICKIHVTVYAWDLNCLLIRFVTFQKKNNKDLIKI